MNNFYNKVKHLVVSIGQFTRRICVNSWRYVKSAVVSPTVKQKLGYFNALRLVCAVAISVVITFVILLLSSEQPLDAMSALFLGALKDEFWMSEVLRGAVPLTFAGVAAAVMLKCGQFNMIGEGSFYIGGFVGALVAIYLPVSGVMNIIVACLMSMLVTGIIGFVPAILKAKLQINEFVVSLMLNFIMLWVGMYFLSNVFKDSSSGDIATSLIPDDNRFSMIWEGTYLSSNIYVAIAVVVIIGLFVYKTKHGYTLRMTGDNKSFALSSGLSATGAIVYSQVIGSGIAGLGGAVEILGSIDGRFAWKALPGYGFDGFIVSILAANNPFLVPFAALFLSYLRTGAAIMAVNTDVASELIFVIQAIIIIIIAGQGFMARYKSKILASKQKLSATEVAR